MTTTFKNLLERILEVTHTVEVHKTDTYYGLDLRIGNKSFYHQTAKFPLTPEGKERAVKLAKKIMLAGKIDTQYWMEPEVKKRRGRKPKYDKSKAADQSPITKR